MIRQQAAARAGEKSGMLPPLAVRKSNVIERNLYHVAFLTENWGERGSRTGEKILKNGEVETEEAIMHRLIAHALIKNNKGELLILKRTEQENGTRNFEGGKWDIPGGKVEMFETPGEAAVRETEEETGLKVAIKGIVFEHSNLDRRKNQVFTTLIYLCGYDNDSEITLNPIEHTEYKWVAPEDILEMGDKELVSYMKGLILAVNNK